MVQIMRVLRQTLVRAEAARQRDSRLLVQWVVEASMAHPARVNKSHVCTGVRGGIHGSPSQGE